jgi:hypothetical protein
VKPRSHLEAYTASPQRTGNKIAPDTLGQERNGTDDTVNFDYPDQFMSNMRSRFDTNNALRESNFKTMKDSKGQCSDCHIELSVWNFVIGDCQGCQNLIYCNKCFGSQLLQNYMHTRNIYICCIQCKGNNGLLREAAIKEALGENHGRL